MLSIVPNPYSWHQRAGTRLTYRVDEQLPRELIALAEVEVVVSEPPLTIRVHDMIVIPTAVYERNPPRVAAAEVALAVEILSDGTRTVDRILKFAEHAEAGIGRYWLIDIDDPVTLTAYVLVDGGYELSGEHTGQAVLDVAGHPVTLDLAALVRR